MSELHVGGITVGEGHPTFVIAEIGHNHQGNPELARAMLNAAKEKRRHRSEAPETALAKPVHC